MSLKIQVIFFIVCLVIYAQVRESDGREGFGPGEQEWGYVTVRESAQMFWWLYYVNPITSSSISQSKIDRLTRPLLIWLQGGPGASSTGYGNFEELGPLDVEEQPRNYTWVNDYNVLFIDNPVGTGFSFVNSSGAYARNNQQIAQDLLKCIEGFLKSIPDFKSVPTYITAESYGGKMAAEFALIWFKAQESGEIESNLQGVALGDSWISPIDSVLSWAPFLLHTGMIDTIGFNTIQQAALNTKEAVENKKWSDATTLWSYTEQVIIRVTENINFYNILEEAQSRSSRETQSSAPGSLDRDNDALLDYLMNNKVKQALGLNVTWNFSSPKVFQALHADFMKPVTHIVEQLLNETTLEVFVFTGQLDLIVATPGTLAWVEGLKWQGAEIWKNTTRISVNVDHIIEGYIKEYKKFKMYWINRSGHMVPRDNPYATSAMLRDLTSKT